MSSIYVPVLIASLKPFRLIARSSSDKWEATLEEINNGDYNYIKLHRTSRAFNAHLSNKMAATFGFDGSLILPLMANYQNDNLVIDEVNRILASIFLGGIYIEAITPFEISKGHMTKLGYYRYTQTYSQLSEFHQAIGEGDAGRLGAIKLFKPEIIMVDSLIAAYNYGHKVLSKLTNLSPFLFIGAFTYYKNHQLRESLANSWITIEQLIEFLWDKLILNDSKTINIPKRRKFLESQQWNASHKIEIFFQQSLITDKLYSLLNEARAARNNFIHKGTTPSYKGANASLLALISLIELASKFNQVNFDHTKLESYLSNHIESCIPQTKISQNSIHKNDVICWRKITKIPGEAGWEGEYENFSDIQLKPLKIDN
ncbi:hypothetical protein [Gilliamella sp. CG35]|uniref:hypothetical protein n=1 Tax=Gilliamella sp. CG35 TaxID=3351507 RepID=UPI003985DAB2